MTTMPTNQSWDITPRLYKLRMLRRTRASSAPTDRNALSSLLAQLVQAQDETGPKDMKIWFESHNRMRADLALLLPKGFSGSMGSYSTAGCEDLLNLTANHIEAIGWGRTQMYTDRHTYAEAQQAVSLQPSLLPELIDVSQRRALPVQTFPLVIEQSEGRYAAFSGERQSHRSLVKSMTGLREHLTRSNRQQGALAAIEPGWAFWHLGVKNESADKQPRKKVRLVRFDVRHQEIELGSALKIVEIALGLMPDFTTNEKQPADLFLSFRLLGHYLAFWSGFERQFGREWLQERTQLPDLAFGYNPQATLVGILGQSLKPALFVFLDQVRQLWFVYVEPTD